MGLSIKTYERDLIDKFKKTYNYKYAEKPIGETKNIMQFWTMLITILQIHYIDIPDVNSLNLNGLMKHEMRLLLEPRVVPEAVDVVASIDDSFGNITEYLAGYYPNPDKNPLRCDIYIESTKTLIEQKSNRFELYKPTKRSYKWYSETKQCHYLSAYHQALEYCCHFPEGEAPHRIITSNFREIRVYEGRDSNKEVIIPMRDLDKHFKTLLPIIYEGGTSNV